MNLSHAFPIVARIVVIILLLIGTSDQPMAFYGFLRLIVFVATLYFAYKSFLSAKRQWAILYAGIAVIFNPLIRVYLDKGVWQVIDVAVTLVLFTSLFTLKTQNANGA